VPEDPALWAIDSLPDLIAMGATEGRRAGGYASPMCVDVRGGLEGGHWAPNGCSVMEIVFVCLCIE
jgi:hypothetical protein